MEEAEKFIEPRDGLQKSLTRIYRPMKSSAYGLLIAYKLSFAENP